MSGNDPMIPNLLLLAYVGCFCAFQSSSPRFQLNLPAKNPRLKLVSAGIFSPVIMRFSCVFHCIRATTHL